MKHQGRLTVRHAACAVMHSAPPIARRRVILEAVYCQIDFQPLRAWSKVYLEFFQKLRHMWLSRHYVVPCRRRLAHLCIASTHVCQPTQVCVNVWRHDGDDCTACMTTRSWRTISAQAILFFFSFQTRTLYPPLTYPSHRCNGGNKYPLPIYPFR